MQNKKSLTKEETDKIREHMKAIRKLEKESLYEHTTLDLLGSQRAPHLELHVGVETKTNMQ
jgi:hypothetical protein